MPFSREQVASIVTACTDYPDRSNAPKVHALVLLLRYSGLRIRDAVTLGRERIRDGKLFLYTAKTGTAVWCPLPPFVVEALESLAGGGAYFFWTGQSKPKSAVGDWQRSLRRLFRLAGVPDGHAHRFRDTFAVELLLAGVPLERVSILLGHQSVKVTEKHYTPWVRARQRSNSSPTCGAPGTWTSSPSPKRRGRRRYTGKVRVQIELIPNRLRVVEAAGVEPASENVTGQEPTCVVQFMPSALPWDVTNDFSSSRVVDAREQRPRPGCGKQKRGTRRRKETGRECISGSLQSRSASVRELP
jgi:hypothetical protein